MQIHMKLQREDKNVKLKKGVKKKSNSVYTYSKYKSGELTLILIYNRFTECVDNDHYSNVITIQQSDTKLRPKENY